MMLTGKDQIQVKGFRGDIEYTVDEKATDLTVVLNRVDPSPTANSNSGVSSTIDDWQFGLRRESDIIHLSVESAQSKQAWAQTLSSVAQQPKFNLRIKAPSLPTKLNWHEGRFTARNFSASLQVNLVNGEVVLQKGSGDLRLVIQSGTAKVSGWTGPVHLQTYDAALEVVDVEGELRLDNFAGVSRVTGVLGGVQLTSHKGDTRASQIKGKLEFTNGNSPLHIEGIEGELRGKTMQGAVFATVKGEANVKLESQAGQVNLRLPQSGAWVNLGTEEGALNVPGFLKLTRLASQQIRTGKLKGSVGGSVYVRTTSGDIQLR